MGQFESSGGITRLDPIYSHGQLQKQLRPDARRLFRRNRQLPLRKEDQADIDRVTGTNHTTESNPIACHDSLESLDCRQTSPIQNGHEQSQTESAVTASYVTKLTQHQCPVMPNICTLLDYMAESVSAVESPDRRRRQEVNQRPQHYRPRSRCYRSCHRRVPRRLHHELIDYRSRRGLRLQTLRGFVAGFGGGQGLDRASGPPDDHGRLGGRRNDRLCPHRIANGVKVENRCSVCFCRLRSPHHRGLSSGKMHVHTLLTANNTSTTNTTAMNNDNYIVCNGDRCDRTNNAIHINSIEETNIPHESFEFVTNNEDDPDDEHANKVNIFDRRFQHPLSGDDCGMGQQQHQKYQFEYNNNSKQQQCQQRLLGNPLSKSLTLLGPSSERQKWRYDPHSNSSSSSSCTIKTRRFYSAVNEDLGGSNNNCIDSSHIERDMRLGPLLGTMLRCGGHADADGIGDRRLLHEGPERHAKFDRKRRTRAPSSPNCSRITEGKFNRTSARWLLRVDLLLTFLFCITLNTTGTLSSATAVEHEPVEDRDQQNRELLLPTIAQRHLLTRQQQRSFYSNEVVRLLNQRQNTSAALQYIEEAHDKWNRKQESCHRANLTPFGIKLTLERDHTGHIVNSKYQIFEGAERIAQRTADFLARLFQKSAPKHLHPKGRDNLDDQPISHIVYAALTSANLLDSSDGRMIVGSGIVIEERGVNIYAYQLGRGHRIQYHANYSYDSDESVLKSRWYRDLVKRWGSTYSRIKHPAGTWSSPYFDCGFSNHWLITYAAPIIVATTENNSLAGDGGRSGRAADRNINDTTGSPAEEESLRRLLGVATISINLNRHDINQCHGDDPFFSDTHHCDVTTTTCDPVTDKGFRRGNYRCRCKEGFYLPPSLFDTEPLINGHAVEMDFLEKSMNITEPERTSVAQLRCLPCPLGCTTCEDEVPCFVEANTTLRGSLLITQLVCGFLVLIMMFIIYKLRKNRQFASSMWILLEAICLGALLIYISIMCRYFEPSAISCILEPWLRELGFATLYGAIVLKIYRIVAEFQTRKAHRVCVRSKDLLRYLIGLVLSVALYMAAWTAMVVDSGGGNAEDIVVNSTSPQGLRFLTCRPLVWDLVTECAEILFLGLSMRLAFRLRNAQSFPEAKGLSRAISVEAGFSLPLYIIKHTLPEGIQPDYVFLAYFIRCHLTVTLVLMLIFLPKLCHRRGAAARSTNAKGTRATGVNQSGTAVSNESCLDPAQRLHQAIVGNGELDIAEISLADMDPEEIRAELRRAYTQLEVLRNKSMRRDNPHISKRRGGRKATHRRFSLQPFHHRHKHNSQQNQQHSAMASASGTSDNRQHGQHHGHYNHPNLPETTEVSKTPEESTASMEGTFAADGPSVTSLSAEHRGGERAGASHKHHH